MKLGLGVIKNRWSRLTLGIVTQTPNTNSSPEALLAAADQQLYQAKRAGRDRVCAIEIA